MTCYKCPICLSEARDAVVTKCGHLYCWECLKRWLDTKPSCPLCHGVVHLHNKGDIIPIYSSSTEDGTSTKKPHSFDAKDHKPAGSREAPQDDNGHRHSPNFGGSCFIMVAPNLLFPLLLALFSFISSDFFLLFLCPLCFILFFAYIFFSSDLERFNSGSSEGGFDPRR